MTEPGGDRGYGYTDARRRHDRTINEMLGMVRGLVCDGVLNEQEVFAFRSWLSNYPDITVSWPGSVLAERLVRAIEDGKVSPSERLELYELFCDTIGEGDISGGSSGSFATRLPFDEPPPEISFPGNLFCFTGAFIYGERMFCEGSTSLRGGLCRSTVIKKPMTLVIGGYGNNAWAHSPYGRKIEKAMKYRDDDVPIAIVCEEVWAKAIKNAPMLVKRPPPITPVA